MPRLAASWWPLFVVPALAAGVAPDRLAAQSAYEELQTFSGVLNHIRVNYADSVTYAELVRAAIDGMLRSLDPHSYFLSRRDWERQEAFERGDLVGTGVTLDEEDSAATVLSLTPDGPAARAGVEPGDRIAEIADTSVAGLKLEEVELRLAGPKGSKVRVKLERGLRLEPETLTVTLKREALKPPPVVWTAMVDSVTGYLQLIWFGPKAAAEVRDGLKRLERQGARQLVLDLRNNPGGIVDAAVEIASDFLPKATVVFRTKGRKQDANQDFVTQHDGDFRDLPLVVLINGGSASASEALAGSLQDHDRALILGRRSFGKALVLAGFVVLPAGDRVQLTIARVYTPSGRIIQRRYKGLAREQYLAFAGKAGAAEDTLTVFRTDHGRAVRGGGGIVPDVVLAAPGAPPVWWSVAADSGFVAAVADSVAQTLPATAAARAHWIAGRERWAASLLVPFLARVRARLHVAAQPDSLLADRMALLLAVRAATVRWPPDGGDELRVRNDSDIRAAVGTFPRLAELLSGSP
jgi:carboxyl-terminal processing protease